MLDTPHAVFHTEPLSPRLLRYLQRRELRLKEEIGSMITLALESWRSQHQDLTPIHRALQELSQRLRRLEEHTNARFDQIEHRRRLAAAKDRGSTRERDQEGRLVDHLLTAVEDRRVLLHMKQRQLARILDVDHRQLTKWLARKVSPSNSTTRERMKDWLAATDEDARRLKLRLLEEGLTW